MTGGGIERVLRSASAALTGRPSLSLWNSCGLRRIAPI